MKLEIKVQVEKEAYELGQGIKNMTLSCTKALKDGFQPGQDLPVVLQAAMVDLFPALQGVEKLGLELEEDASAFVKAFVLSAEELAVGLVKELRAAKVVNPVGGN